MTKSYHVKGIFNGGSSFFSVNPKGWIGKTVCMELSVDDFEHIEDLYLKKVKEEVTFMNVGMVGEVEIIGPCNCERYSIINQN